MDDFGLYIIITEPLLPYSQIAKICVEEEIRIIQLREKNLKDSEIVTIGKEILQITRDTGTKLIINDRPDLAAMIGADGYHLGQDDLSLSRSRKIYPQASLVGLSTHNPEQVKRALELKPDYLGFGPLYNTPTKKIPDPVTGVVQLTKILQFVKFPVVAIGGIDNTNLEEVLQGGAQNIALVRYFMQTKFFQERIREVKEICQQYWRKP